MIWTPELLAKIYEAILVNEWLDMEESDEYLRWDI